MRLSALLAAPLLGTLAAAEYVLQSTSLSTCQDNSGWEASKFDVVFTPNNNSLSVTMIATSSIEGKVKFDFSVSAYGYQIIRKTIDPCDTGLAGFCPMTPGDTGGTPFILTIPPDATSQIPSLAYQFPDLDAKVRVYINSSDTGNSLACLETSISNSRTVDLDGVKWASAVVVGLALISSAIISGLGHANAASHIAANAVSLCGYFQAQAMVGLTGIPLPPSVQAWTQDFQWSIGVIKVDFLQTIFTWYQRSTGGTPSQLFDSLGTISVQVSKRSLQPALGLARRASAMAPRALHSLRRRGNEMNSSGSYVVFGIQRVAYRAEIESTNLFMTGFVVFCLVLAFSALFVALAKGLCELAAKMKWIKGDTFQEFRNEWRTILKGVLYRMTLIGYPAVTVLCFWEFTQNDSPAEMVIAVFFLIYTSAALGFAAWKVIKIARNSVTLHRTPAYILFSDPHSLNKWGFLYMPFRASAYYFIVPVLGYFIIKGLFIGLAQKSGITQAIGLILIEAAALIAASVLRPWMDKKLNSFNISIAVVNFINSICLLIFTDVFGQPALVSGVVGVVLWLLNAITTLVLIIFCLVSTTFVFFRENPDGRYRFMSDERASFMKSSQSLSAANQLDALATTARGEKTHGMDMEGDESSYASGQPRPDTAHSRSSRHGPVLPYAETNHQAVPLMSMSGRSSPSVTQGPLHVAPPPSSAVSGPPSPAFRAQNNSSPWQRGAGYDHAS